MNIFTVAFFGHRDFYVHHRCENKLIPILKGLINTKEYVDFLVGRNGEFDIFASSYVKRAKNELWDCNSSLILVLPYPTAEFRNSEEYFVKYYDEVEICEKSAIAHYKSAMQIRNREMVDRADLIICYIERKNGGAFQSIQYAEKQGKTIINLADNEEGEDREFLPS